MNQRDPEQFIRQQVKARLYEKGRNIGFGLCSIWPIALVILVPSVFENLLVGAVLVVLSIAQFLWVPDQVGKWMEKAD